MWCTSTERIPSRGMNFSGCLCSRVYCCVGRCLFPLLCLCAAASIEALQCHIVKFSILLFPDCSSRSSCWCRVPTDSSTGRENQTTTHLPPPQLIASSPSRAARSPLCQHSVCYGLFLDFVKMCIPSTTAQHTRLALILPVPPVLFRSLVCIFHQFHLPA